jgi:hypothetical protein
MLTMAVRPMAPGERFAVRTPTDRLSVRYPDEAFLRVNSYLDAISLTAERDTLFRLDRTTPTQTDRGETKMFRGGVRTFPDKPVDQQQFAAWDGWVANRQASREAAMSATMKQAGLAEQLPGLAEMKDVGHFYPCAPYGTCWEPKDGWAGQANAAQAAIPIQAGQTTPLGAPNQQNQLLAVNPYDYVDFFPCSPFRLRSQFLWDPSRQMYVAGPRLLSAYYPYEWTVCHAGSWIRREHRYVWVVGRKRHHHPPVRWVKAGGKVGFVPLHPRDVAGKPPLNLKDGIFHPTDKKGAAFDHLAFSGDKPLKVLDEAPKAFHIDDLPRLGRAEAPRVEARMVKAGAPPAPVTFDHKSQSFMVAHTSLQPGGSSGARTVMEPIGGRGAALQGQARGGSVQTARSSGGSYGGGSSAGASVSRGSSGGVSSASSGGVSHASAPAPAPAASSSVGKPH